MADQPEDDAVQNSTVHINWRTFNIPSLITVLGAAIAVVTYVNGLDARLAKVEENSVSRSEVSDRKFDDIQLALGTLNNTPYRVGILEQQATAINIRIDRFTEVISNTMELIRKDVGALGTKVEVMSNKIDSLSADKRAELGSTPDLVRR